MTPAARLSRSAAAAAMALLLAACAVTPLPPTTPPAPPPPGQPGPPPGPALPSLGWFSNIKVPDGHQPVLRLTGRGVQVFRCELREGAHIWAFRLPEADLADERGTVLIRHGANFSFEHIDGSRLIGSLVASDAAPRDANLRWLLLSTRAFGTGALAGISYVQRVDTSGGMPPPRCDVRQLNQLLRVDFSADFVFYRPG